MNMIITQIKALNKTKYVISFSNDSNLSCNEDLIINYNLFKNKEITDTLYNELLSKSIVYDYYTKAISYLSKGLKSKNKIYNYLVSKDSSKKVALEVIDLLLSKNLLNDSEYFKLLTNHYITKGYGPLYIKLKGIEEKIDSNIIQEVLDNINEEEYKTYLVEFGLKKIKELSNKEKDNQKIKMKVKNYLYQRGYQFDMINDSIERIFNENR